MRGEHILFGKEDLTPLGSSPHAWGTPPILRWLCGTHRFIPTCVGNTHAKKGHVVQIPVHPHMRGEHHRGPKVIGLSLGSSPHAWGTHTLAAIARVVQRFIPTCVGNTCKQATGSSHCPVHPHMRGEHSRALHFQKLSCGSSPHAWGTPVTPRLKLPVFRFIPTCVGNTIKGLGSVRLMPVHPHMRGEHSFTWGLLPGPYGSSPHAWGTHLSSLFTLRAKRFIPTCVGNTSTKLFPRVSRSVHPHMRGEHR